MLADAADVLSDQLRHQLSEFAELLSPQIPRIERRFRAKLAQGESNLARLDPRPLAALLSITPGAAFTLIHKGLPLSRFFEQVEYNGRRLAKMNLPPTAIAGALEQYDRMLAPVLDELLPGQQQNLRWVREQLLFCVILTLNNAFYQVREAETRAFYELFRVELESRNLEELLVRILSTLTEFCNASRARLFLLDDDEDFWIQRAAWNPARPKLRQELIKIPNAAKLRRSLSEPRCWIGASCPPESKWNAGHRTCWSIPLSNGKRIVGAMQFAFVKEFEWLPREVELLAAAAERCWMAIEKARLVEGLAAREEQVRQLAGHMLQVEEAERRRISRELHDEAGQSLLCIRLQMEMVENSLPEELAAERARLAGIRNYTEKTILEIRRLIAALSPAVLEQLGLGAALRQLVNRFRQMHPAKVRLQLGRIAELPKSTEVIVYRLVQECFNNIAKHSQARAVNISVGYADGILKLMVEDNGIGFNVEEAFSRTGSFGLSGIRERVALLGGTFQIQSHPGFPKIRSIRGSRRNTRGGGTKIQVELPVPSESETPQARKSG